MTTASYGIHSPKGSIGAAALRSAAPCAVCGGPRAIGAFANPVCAECRIRLGDGESLRMARGLTEAAAAAGIAATALAKAVRDRREAPGPCCEACGQPVGSEADLFDVFGVGRVCLRCLGMDDAVPFGAGGCAHCGARRPIDDVLCGPCRDGVRRALGGRCPECNGNGWVLDRSYWSDGATTEDCPACGGTGSGVAA